METTKIADITIEKIVSVLENGGLVIMPTETMYGAMVDATNTIAVKKLTQYKNRPFGKPYSIAVTDIYMAKQYADVNLTAENIYERFLPGPVTVISRQKAIGNSRLAPGVASESNTIGIRIPDYKLIIEVVKKLAKPITATSANASYKKRPYSVNDILDNLSDKQKNLIDLIIDAGELPHREPSTVIDTTLDDTVTLRQGDILVNSHQLSVVSYSEEDTKNIGKEMWQKYEQYAGQRAIVYALEGQMGVGKTQFTKGLAKAMGIEEEVVSPTFALEMSYQLPVVSYQLSHIDAWRMKDSTELESLGFKSLITDRSVIVIEWADRVEEIIRKYNEEAVIVWIKIEYGHKENERKISWATL